jgi:HEAT repeat protein
MKNYQELRILLSEIEPSEKMFNKISADDIPNLKMMLKDSEALLSARAIFALSRLENEKAYSIIDKATTDERSAVRVAIAVASASLPQSFADKIIDVLLRDNDPGVRQWAINSISVHTSDKIKDQLRKLSINDSNDYIKSISQEKLSILK